MGAAAAWACPGAAESRGREGGPDRAVFSGALLASLAPLTEWGSTDALKLRVHGYWAVWWDPRYDHAADADFVVARLEEVRRECTGPLGMSDPPNPARGHYYNIYIHHRGDAFPDGWACGQGTDCFGLPYLTLPGDGCHRTAKTLYHEAFHIFQYRATSSGFSYSGVSQWYVEASAQWYMVRMRPSDSDVFIEASCISMNPHLALWHTLENGEPTDALDWLYMCRLYALNTWLIYLTRVSAVQIDRSRKALRTGNGPQIPRLNLGSLGPVALGAPALGAPSWKPSKVACVPSDVVTGGFYAGVTWSPQEHHLRRVGDPLRGHFADWAACNAGGLERGFRYLSGEQRARAAQELEAVTRAGQSQVANRHELAATLEAPLGEDALCFRPQAFAPRGWAYNVLLVRLPRAGPYTVVLRGDPEGTEGQASHFLGRVVVGSRRHAMEMVDSRASWPCAVVVGEGEREMYVVVVSVPAHFGGNQEYGYEVEVRSGAWGTPGQRSGGEAVASAAEMRRKRLEALERRSG